MEEMIPPMNPPKIEILPLKKGFLRAAADATHVLVRIVAPSQPADVVATPRAPLDLALVIDRSGSMSGRPLEAALESAAFQTAELLEAMAKDGVAPQTLRVDGGMVANNWLCQDLADSLGVAARVTFVGLVAQADLAWWYSAADALALCSSREGWANVLLESMACGTPVVATNIWGTPEVVTCGAAGQLMSERNAPSLAEAWHRLRGNPPERSATRAYAEGFSWNSTTQGQLALFRRVLAQGAS